MDRRGELLEVIRSVRNRWRQRLAIRGAVVVVAGTLLALFLSASSLQALRFSPAAIITFRFVAIAVFAALVWQFLARAMRRQVTDGQVAMYLEETRSDARSGHSERDRGDVRFDHLERPLAAPRRETRGSGDHAVPVARAWPCGRSPGGQTARG